jgi:hypothetical protein
MLTRLQNFACTIALILWFSAPGDVSAFVISTDCFGNVSTEDSSTNPSANTSTSCTKQSMAAPEYSTEASIDLSSQSMSVFASTEATGASYAASYISQMVTVEGTWTGTTSVALSLTVTGAFFGASSTNQAAVGSIAIAGGTIARADYYYLGSGNFYIDPSYSSGDFIVQDSSTGADNIDTLLTIMFDLDANTPTFNLITNLVGWAWGNNGAMTTDFGHTGQLSISLAQGLTATTDSGFAIPLTNPPNGSVPEPSVIALALIGLLALRFSIRCTESSHIL